MARGKKTPSFVCQLRLAPSRNDVKALRKSLEAGRLLYNACLGEILKRLRLMRQSKDYQAARGLPRDSKERTAAFSRVRERFGFQEYDLHRFALECKNASHIQDHIDTHVAQKIATRVYSAANRYALGMGGRPRFKGKGRLNSLESKTDASGIRYRDGQMRWQGLTVPCVVDASDAVQAHGLERKIKYGRLVRRTVKGKERFYLQLVVEGVPYQKEKNRQGAEVVGIDVGPSTIAWVGESQVGLETFCDELGEIEEQIGKIQRKMDRSRRAANPGNYNKDGTVKKDAKKWVKSNRGEKLQEKAAELCRRRAAHRKSLHGRMANRILKVGNRLQIEKNSYKAFQKLYGRSVGRRGPGLFVSMLSRKAESAGGSVLEIPAWKFKFSQLCVCRRVKKKPLSQREHHCECGVHAQRDLFSAFLARCVEVEKEEQKLDASRAEKLWREADPLLRQAASGDVQSAIGGRKPDGLEITPRQSGLSVESGPRDHPGERLPVDAGDAVTAAEHCCRESSGEAGSASDRTPWL